MPNKKSEPRITTDDNQEIIDIESPDAAPETPQKNWLGVSVIVVLLLLAGSVAYFRYAQDDKTTGANQGTTADSQPTITTEPTALVKVASSLDGTQVTQDIANRRPLAIMVENHVDARPQYGLGAASVVYEAIAEGGITRFLALFGAGDSTKVGPVRSARTYYLDWALEYDAGYAHVGGNIDALDLIPQIGIKDLDQFGLGTRAYRREAHGGVATEHTMYTDTSKLRTIMDEKFGSEQDWTKPSFKDGVAKEHRPASQKVTVEFSSAQFQVDWTYDPETNSYIRSLAGSLHKDPVSGEALRADNVFVQVVQKKATTTRINENGWIFTTVGEGKAQVFQDGKRIEATWKKANRNAPTKFLDPAGAEISRNVGTTWVEIVHPETVVTTS